MLNMRAESEAIMRWLCAAYGLGQDELTGPVREHPMSEARIVGYYLARRRGMSYPVIGRLFNRDHTTVMSGVKRADALLKRDANVAALVVKFCAERDAFDADALLLVAAYRGDELETPRAGPVENGLGKVGESGAMPVVPLELPSPSEVSSSESVPEPFLLLSSGSEPESKPARAAKRKPETAAPADFTPEFRVRVADWARSALHRDSIWANERLDSMLTKCKAKDYRYRDWFHAACDWLRRDVVDQARFGKPPGAFQHEQLQAQETRRRPELRPILPPRPVQEATPLEVLAHVGQVLPKRPAPAQEAPKRFTAAELDRAVEELAAGRAK